MASLIQNMIEMVDRRLQQMADHVAFKPVLDRVLVREIPREKSKIVGTHLQASEHYAKESDRAVVVAIGDGVPMGGVLMPIPFQVGDVVHLGNRYSLEQIYLKPEDENDPSAPKYFLVRCADLLGKFLDV
jgi:co-chaperonin GroES (HSP10)